MEERSRGVEGGGGGEEQGEGRGGNGERGHGHTSAEVSPSSFKEPRDLRGSSMAT